MFHINNIKLNLYIKNKTRIVKPLFFIIYKGRNEKKKKKKKRVKFLIEFGDYINKMNSHGSRILLYIVWKDDNENIIKNLF